MPEEGGEDAKAGRADGIQDAGEKQHDDGKERARVACKPTGSRFSHLILYGHPKEQDKLSIGFLDYQLIEEMDIPGCIWDDAMSRVNIHW
ncbi:UNVERIFIED_CONTAM: hypothetical protein FKN15_014967 [Acipenser sinensis]